MQGRNTIGRRPHRQHGFIITVELLLIVTILVIGSIVGLVAIRDALVKRVESQRSQDVYVSDVNGVTLGKAIGFDEHEAPLVPYIDRTVPPLVPDPAHRNFRALLAIRDDRFTTREPVYYDGANCTGTPCVKGASDEDTDSFGVERLGETGAVSYLYGLQRSPVYAVGASSNQIPGFLYRGTARQCPVEPAAIQSRYLSQRVVSGSPCESFQLGRPGPPDTTCLADLGDACGCPAGTADQGNILSFYAEPIDELLQETVRTLNGTLSPLATVPDVGVGELCCPTGTVLQDDGNLVNTVVYVILEEVIAGLGLDETTQATLVDPLLRPLAGTLSCTVSARLQAAEPVPDPNNPQLNALERFAAPFTVNLPADAGSDGDSWISTPPNGEGIRQ